MLKSQELRLTTDGRDGNKTRLGPEKPALFITQMSDENGF